MNPRIVVTSGPLHKGLALTGRPGLALHPVLVHRNGAVHQSRRLRRVAKSEAPRLVPPVATQQIPVTESKAFLNWFGDSKVVATGAPQKNFECGPGHKPAVLFYGGPQAADVGAEWGFVFTPDAESARRQVGDQPIEAYLRITNPHEMRFSAFYENVDNAVAITHKLMSAGHDGIHVTNGDGSYEEWVVFDTKQIKATTNHGEFDPESGDIFKAIPEGTVAVRKLRSDHHMQTYHVKHGRAFWVTTLGHSLRVQGTHGEFLAKHPETLKRHVPSYDGGEVTTDHVAAFVAKTKMARVRHYNVGGAMFHEYTIPTADTATTKALLQQCQTHHRHHWGEDDGMQQPLITVGGHENAIHLSPERGEKWGDVYDRARRVAAREKATSYYSTGFGKALAEDFPRCCVCGEMLDLHDDDKDLNGKCYGCAKRAGELDTLSKSLSSQQQAEVDAEDDVIRQNKKKPAATQPHSFKRAKWSFPNGHPRCLICGDEEPYGGRCNMSDEWYAKHSGHERLEKARRVHPQPKAPAGALDSKGGQFVKTDPAARAKQLFDQHLLGKTLRHEPTGMEWTVGKPGLVKTICEKKGKKKGGCRNEAEMSQLYDDIGNGKRDAASIPGFNAARVAAIPLLPKIISDPDEIWDDNISAKSGHRRVVFVKKFQLGQHAYWVGIEVKPFDPASHKHDFWPLSFQIYPGNAHSNLVDKTLKWSKKGGFVDPNDPAKVNLEKAQTHWNEPMGLAAGPNSNIREDSTGLQPPRSKASDFRVPVPLAGAQDPSKFYHNSGESPRIIVRSSGGLQ